VGKRRLAQPRGGKEEYVIECFASLPGRFDEDGQLFARFGLSRVFGQAARTQRPFEAFFASQWLSQNQPLGHR